MFNGLGVSTIVHQEAAPFFFVLKRRAKNGGSWLRRCGVLARASDPGADWKLSPFPSFKLWSGSRNSGGVPVLHRQRGGHSCRQQRQDFFAVPQTPFIDRVMVIPVVRARLAQTV